jgi:hypothetical protein
MPCCAPSPNCCWLFWKLITHPYRHNNAQVHTHTHTQPHTYVHMHLRCNGCFVLSCCPASLYSHTSQPICSVKNNSKQATLKAHIVCWRGEVGQRVGGGGGKGWFVHKTWAPNPKWSNGVIVPITTHIYLSVCSSLVIWFFF